MSASPPPASLPALAVDAHAPGPRAFKLRPPGAGVCVSSGRGRRGARQPARRVCPPPSPDSSEQPPPRWGRGWGRSAERWGDAAALAEEAAAAGGYRLLGATGGGRRDHGTEGRGSARAEAPRASGPRVGERPHTPTRRGFFPQRPRLPSSCGGRRRSRGGVSTRGRRSAPSPRQGLAGIREDNPRAQRRAVAG